MDILHKETFWHTCVKKIPCIFLSAAFLFHALQAAFCLGIHTPSLPELNLTGACIDLGLLLLSQYKPAPSVFLGEMELCIFSVAATVFSGWGAGFYLLPLGMLGAGYFLSDFVKNGSGIMMQAVNLLVLMILLLIRARLPAQPGEITPPGHLTSPLFFGNLAACTVMVLLSSHLFRSALRSYRCKLEKQNQDLEYMAVHDPLTGLHNRWTVTEALSRCKEQSDRTGVPFSAALADVDNFKEFNDRFGHCFGDHVLAQLAQSVRHSIGREDFAFRWGGEELLFLFPATDKSDAKRALLRIQQDIRKIPDLNPPGCQVTLTFGLCAYLPGQTPEQLLALADRKLYEGKALGKDCIVD